MVEEESKETLEQVLLRHRKELKELTNQITGLKKQAKADKKRKPELLKMIEDLKIEMEARHQKELLRDDNEKQEQETNNQDEPQVQTQDQTQDQDSVVKTNRQKLRKQKKEERKEQIRQEALNEETVDLKSIESAEFEKILTNLGKSLNPIEPDGHCLYNSIADQLRLYGLKYNFKQLREMTCDYLLAHMDDVLPFMTGKNGLMNEDEFEEYCRMIRDTAIWGGQIEIQALSKIFKVQVNVVQVGSPVLSINEDSSLPQLWISYHKHEYGLGEHYNSLY